MTDTPSRAMRLFGTDEPVAPPRLLRAGPLSAELDAGNLRYIRYHGAEVLRAVSFIVRDRDWGTYSPAITELKIEEGADRFEVRLSAVASDAGQSFAYVARIEGHAEGRLVFHGRGASDGGFLTNRTGFVILHPIDGVAGAPVRITHVDGRVVDGRFPEIIDPVQPMMDLRALEHVTPHGLAVSVLMEGDTFEMEDQRNWTDASYKTYVRPLARPWPYRIEPGEVIDQTVTLTVSGTAPTLDRADAAGIRPGTAGAPVPPLGLGLRPEDAAATADALDRLRALAPAYLILHHDPRDGHDRATLTAQLALARAAAAQPWLEAVIATPDDAGAQVEVAALGALAAELGQPFETVMVSPAADLKCTLPGSPWPPAPDARVLYAATRAAFPGARIGGGMFSYFTELNRKRPPQDALDLVSFSTSPMVHAGDDRSVMETREAHPAVIASVRLIAGATPWAVGPSAIGVRDNPYGAAAKSNPSNIRQAMNGPDPRQRGLLGAVWALGYFSDFASGGAAGVALGALAGPFGAIASPGEMRRPARGLRPVFHVLRGLARLRGAPMRPLGLSPSAPLVGIAAQTAAGVEIWIGNATPDPVETTLAADGASAAVLDCDSHLAAAGSPEHMDALSPVKGERLRLDGHAIIRIVTAGA